MHKLGILDLAFNRLEGKYWEDRHSVTYKLVPTTKLDVQSLYWETDCSAMIQVVARTAEKRCRARSFSEGFDYSLTRGPELHDEETPEKVIG